MKKILIIISLLFLFASCNNSEDEVKIDKSLAGIYSTNHIQIVPAIDLNRDGNTSTNLFEESLIKSSTLQIDEVVNSKGLLTILFPYVYVDTLTSPYSYQEGTNAINTHFTLADKTLISDDSEVLSATVLNETDIEIHMQKEFYLENKWQNVEMRAIYTKTE